MALFEEHLNTNYAPSDKELLEIARILVEPQANLAMMNDEIERVQATLDDLQHQRDELVQRIDQYLALTSPIRRIPQEILQEIFINCLPTNRNAIMSAREAPLLLGRVCSSWRSISLSTPRLWTTVHVPIPNTTPDSFPSEISTTSYVVASKHMANLRTAALQEWLRRSEALPVDISLSQWDEAPSDTNPHISQHVVDVILSVAQRWRKMTVSAPLCSTARFLTHSSHDLPFLESLAVDFSRFRSLEPIFETPVSKHNIFRTPSLRQLFLKQPKGKFLQLPVNWACLTDLAMEGHWGWNKVLSLHQAMDLLSRCPCLVRCRLEISTAEVAAVQFSTLTLSKLESLSIFANADVTHLFNCLDLPALLDVEYDSAISPHPTMKASLLTLLRKLDGSLQKFTTDPQLFTREDFIECLRLIPDATTLAFKQSRIQKIRGSGISIDQTTLDKELLYSFLPSATDALCPQLKFLEITSLSNFSDEDLLSFILEKRGGGPSHNLKLKQVKIVFTRSRKMDIAPHLTGFVEEGLDLRLTYPAQPAEPSFSPLAGLHGTTWI